MRDKEEEIPRDLAIIFTTMIVLCLMALVGLVIWKLIMVPVWNWAT